VASTFLVNPFLKLLQEGAFHKLGEASLKGEVIEGRANMEDWEWHFS
jgi:hypothetical protein